MSGRDTKNRDDQKRIDFTDSIKPSAAPVLSSVWNRHAKPQTTTEKDDFPSFEKARDKDKESDSRDRIPKERDRDRRQDKERDHRPRLSDREKERGNRHRDRDKRDRGERSCTSSETFMPPIQGPIVLLRRPAAAPTTSGQTPSTTREPEVSDNKNESSDVYKQRVKAHGEKSLPIAPVLLQRPTTNLKSSRSETAKDTPERKLEEQSNAVSIEKSKRSTAEAARNSLRPFTNFPEKYAIPVIDKDMKIRPFDSFNFFNERGKITGDYFVITTIGQPLTGKSKILSYLAGHRTNNKIKLFPARSRGNEMESLIYITSDNVIYIEMSPIFNCAAARNLASKQGNLENNSLTWNLKLVRWALAVSHVVLIVSDNLLDPNLCQLISSSEMIHPLESALGEGVYPEIVFTINKVQESTLNDPELLDEYQCIISSIIGRNPRIQPNIFMLPEIQLPNSVERFNDLKTSIFRFMRYNRAPHMPETTFPKVRNKYNAYDWYCNATKIWEKMQHPNYFASYTKLLP